MIQISNVKNTKKLSNGKNNSCFDSFIFVCALYPFLLCNCVFCQCFQMVAELTCAPSTNIVSMTTAKYILWVKKIYYIQMETIDTAELLATSKIFVAFCLLFIIRSRSRNSNLNTFHAEEHHFLEVYQFNQNTSEYKIHFKPGNQLVSSFAKHRK